MSNILPLVQKYRPKMLTELLSQQITIQIINQAIEYNTLANVYLFTGSAGVGKTSAARIIARIINCSQKIKKKSIIESCGKCKNCLPKTHPDIIEIDAASHTTVDEMKNILSSTQYQAILGSHKIYIIDESHMLSKSAFNAALKTFEEPSPNIIFILITTEPHRIPTTIISRSQRLNFKPLNEQDITNLLKTICDKEQINYTIEALQLISQYSEGSARNAILLLEQARLLAQNNAILDTIVIDILGIISIQDNLIFLTNILNKQYSKIFEHIDNLRQKHTYMQLYIESFLKLINFILKRKLYSNFSETKYIHHLNIIDTFIKNNNITKLQELYQPLIQAINTIPKNIRDIYTFFDIIIIQILADTKNIAVQQTQETTIDSSHETSIPNQQNVNMQQLNLLHHAKSNKNNSLATNTTPPQQQTNYNTLNTSTQTQNNPQNQNTSTQTQNNPQNQNTSTQTQNNHQNQNTSTQITPPLSTSLNPNTFTEKKKKLKKTIYDTIILPLLKNLYIQKNFGEYYDIFNHMEVHIIQPNIQTMLSKTNSDTLTPDNIQVSILHKNFSNKLISILQQKLSYYNTTFTNTPTISQSIKQFIINESKNSYIFNQLNKSNINYIIQDLCFNTESEIIHKK